MFAFHDLLDRVRRGVVMVAGSVEACFSLTATVLETVDRIEQKVDYIVTREQVSWDLYQSNVGAIVDGYKALQAENSALKDQIGELSKNQQTKIREAVDAALAEDSDHDAARIDAANQALPIIANGAPIPPKPVDATPQTTESGAHDVPGPDGQPVTVGPDNGSVADPDDASNETNTEDPETTTNPAVNSGDDSGQTATTGDHDSANENQTADNATGSAEESNGGDITGRQSGR